jgi:hypothetical protein
MWTRLKPLQQGISSRFFFSETSIKSVPGTSTPIHKDINHPNLLIMQQEDMQEHFFQLLLKKNHFMMYSKI